MGYQNGVLRNLIEQFCLINRIDRTHSKSIYPLRNKIFNLLFLISDTIGRHEYLNICTKFLCPFLGTCIGYAPEIRYTVCHISNSRFLFIRISGNRFRSATSDHHHCGHNPRYTGPSIHHCLRFLVVTELIRTLYN